MEAKETVEAMEQRHKQELKDLEYKTRAMLKAAKKSEKNVVQAEIIQMQFDLKRKQEEEYDLMIEMGGLSLSDDRTEHVDEARSSSCDADKPDPEELKRLEEEAIAAKKAKAQKKKGKKVTKEEQRQLVKEDIQANAGPSLREMEITRINSVLSKQNLCIKEIASDGHCLYRYFTIHSLFCSFSLLASDRCVMSSPVCCDFDTLLFGYELHDISDVDRSMTFELRIAG